MGLDLHIHDTYFVVGHVPMGIAVLLLAVAIVFGAWKLVKFLWLMLAS